MLENIFAEFN